MTSLMTSLMASLTLATDDVIDDAADDVIDELLHLNIKHGVDTLRLEFPISESTYDPSVFGETATYRMDSDQGYEREHRELFDPIENLYEEVCNVGTAITHFNNGVG